MIDKIASNVADGSIVLIGVFGVAAIPHELIFTAHHLTERYVDQTIMEETAVRLTKKMGSECQRRGSL